MNFRKLFLTIVPCLCLAGCSNDREKDNMKLNPFVNNNFVYNGTHSSKINKLDKMIAKNGESEYTIVLPDNYESTDHLWTAAYDLKIFLGKASSADFQIIKHSEMVQGGKYIIYDSDISKETINLKMNGYRIYTENDNIYIKGHELGLLNGTYHLLNILIKFASYCPNDATFEKGDIYLYDIDVVEVPDIDYRVADVRSNVDGDEAYRRYINYNCNDDVFMYVNGTLFHNSVYYFENEINDPAYNEWFSTDKQQLCYTGHGKDENVKAMQEHIADQIVETAKTSNCNVVTFQESDCDVWCNCEHCQEVIRKYGAYSATMIRFVNSLSEVVQQKMTEAGMGDRQITICVFAYLKTEKAPAKLNENGEFEVVDDSVKCNDNVAVFYAPINADYSKPFNSEFNSSEYESVRAWSAICKKLYIWYYQTNFSHYLYPFNSLPTMAERYKMAALSGAEYLFDQNQWDQKVKTGFHRLKAWMGAKLGWNVNLNYNDLLNEYFDNYFLSAGKTMRQLFDEITYHAESQPDLKGTCYFGSNQKTFFSKVVLDNWLDLINKAYEEILPLQESNPALYKEIKNRINIESISIRYIRLELYSSRFSSEQLFKERNSFRNDCLKLGIDMYSEQVPLSTIFESWGII